MYSGSGVAMSWGLGPCVAESGNCAPAAKPMSARAMNTKNFCAGNKNKNSIWSTHSQIPIGSWFIFSSNCAWARMECVRMTLEPVSWQWSCTLDSQALKLIVPLTSFFRFFFTVLKVVHFQFEFLHILFYTCSLYILGRITYHFDYLSFVGFRFGLTLKFLVQKRTSNLHSRSSKHKWWWAGQFLWNLYYIWPVRFAMWV